MLRKSTTTLLLVITTTILVLLTLAPAPLVQAVPASDTSPNKPKVTSPKTGSYESPIPVHTSTTISSKPVVLDVVASVLFLLALFSASSMGIVQAAPTTANVIKRIDPIPKLRSDSPAHPPPAQPDHWQPHK
ncbi:hypothetical protein BGZ95_003965 [Linnemannia exigua]|uniref:Transmembrane protein n=1 Tax=Linnemannia exigua TaxID=604196 RepID=A0AAD4D3K8_9FUNG|nr:hypothetical protein BGZ95_003965 [Linnemannia exigua]